MGPLANAVLQGRRTSLITSRTENTQNKFLQMKCFNTDLLHSLKVFLWTEFQIRRAVFCRFVFVGSAGDGLFWWLNPLFLLMEVSCDTHSWTQIVRLICGTVRQQGLMKCYSLAHRCCLEISLTL